MVKLTSKFLDMCLAAERCLLCIGWMQHANLNDTGYQLQLGSHHFCRPEYSFIYYYLCLTAQAGKHPDIDECVRLANKLRVDIDEHYLFNQILWTDIQDGMLRTYAETVRDFARKRQHAKKCFREYRHIISGVATSPKRFKRNRNRKKQVTNV